MGKKVTKRGPGRPRLENRADSRLNVRATADRRAKWIASAEASGMSEADWAREGLDVWMWLCDAAKKLNVNPDELAREAVEDHARVRAAVAELTPASSLSAREERVLRVLAPSEWARVKANE